MRDHEEEPQYNVVEEVDLDRPEHHRNWTITKTNGYKIGNQTVTVLRFTAPIGDMKDFEGGRIRLTARGNRVFAMTPTHPRFILMEPEKNFEDNLDETTITSFQTHKTRVNPLFKHLISSLDEIARLRQHDLVEIVAFDFGDREISTHFFGNTFPQQGDGTHPIHLTLGYRKDWAFAPGVLEDYPEGVKTLKMFCYGDVVLKDSIEYFKEAPGFLQGIDEELSRVKLGRGCGK